MKALSKLLSAVVLASSVAFAQNDDLFQEDDLFANTENTETKAEAPAAEEAAPAVGTAKASGNQWDKFNYEDLGLTQWEYQQAKEQGVTREKLTKLVELGIRPTEYLQKPWNRLGVSEEVWLAQRSEGMEDADIDRSYRYHNGDQKSAYLSLLIPSYYQWKTNATTRATFMDVLEVGGIAITVVLKVQDKSEWWYGLLLVAGAHLWSFADAFLGTQWDNNPDANRFSFGIVPNPEKGVTGFFQASF